MFAGCSKKLNLLSLCFNVQNFISLVQETVLDLGVHIYEGINLILFENSIAELINYFLFCFKQK